MERLLPRAEVERLTGFKRGIPSRSSGRLRLAV